MARPPHPKLEEALQMVAGGATQAQACERYGICRTSMNRACLARDVGPRKVMPLRPRKPHVEAALQAVLAGARICDAARAHGVNAAYLHRVTRDAGRQAKQVHVRAGQAFTLCLALESAADFLDGFPLDDADAAEALIWREAAARIRRLKPEAVDFDHL